MKKLTSLFILLIVSLFTINCKPLKASRTNSNPLDTVYTAIAIKEGKAFKAYIVYTIVQGNIIAEKRTTNYDSVVAITVPFKHRNKYKYSLDSNLIKEYEYGVYSVRRN